MIAENVAHFARVLRAAGLADSTHVDLAQYGAEPEPLPIYLAFLGDCDGALEAVRAWLEGRAQATATSPVKLSPRAA